MDKEYRYAYADHVHDAFAYAHATQTIQHDPRDLRTYTEEEFNRLAREAAEKAERAALAAMTPAEQVNKQLEGVASRYGAFKPWAT